jgi:NADH-quinone oxidoreductase subunit N
MNSYFHLLLPELILTAVACLLMLMGCSNKVSVRKTVPVIALLSLIGVFVLLCMRADADNHVASDPAGTLRIFHFSFYIKLLATGVGGMLLLLAWPSNAQGTGNSALNVGQETGEFYALMLLAIVGIFLVASANDLILLFLGIELASIPTYIMVSISRPHSVAQEAGVKYFFLGAMAAAVMLLGFSYLYGVTGTLKLDEISRVLHSNLTTTGAAMAPWTMLALVVLIAGFAFKLAAVPLHVYAGDVYQGAATPVTAFLSFVPKTTGMVALIKVLAATGGPNWQFPSQVVKLLWVIAVLTMTFGNVLGLLQYNIKRLFAYSSVAHSGYMLAGVTALIGAYATTSDAAQVQNSALQGVLFYLAAYGVTNVAAFGVLMLLPSRDAAWGRGFGSAETFEDLAGMGRKYPGLGLCMAVCCFSLIGIPLTVGFLGKLLLIKPALAGDFKWLAVITVVNAAISAAYYLRIIEAMFLREPAGDANVEAAPRPFPIGLAVGLSVAGTLLLGVMLPLTQVVTTSAASAAQLDNASAAVMPTASR